LRSITLLAQLQMLRGRLHQATEAYEEARHAVSEEEELRSLIGSPAYYFGLSDVLREQNNLDIAEYYLAQGMELIRGTLAIIAEVIALGYITLARVQQARGEYSQSLATLDAYTQLAHQRTFVPHLIARGAAVRAQVELARGNLAAAIHWAGTSGLSPYDDHLDYPREQEYLTLVRVRIAQGRTDQRIPSSRTLWTCWQGSARTPRPNCAGAVCWKSSSSVRWRCRPEAIAQEL
jgi:ATP/maltotriose-dependent transcriptional regulator MalT